MRRDGRDPLSRAKERERSSLGVGKHARQPHTWHLCLLEQLRNAPSLLEVMFESIQ